MQFYVDVSANCVFFVFLGRGFEGNDFFVGEVSFENVVEVIGFTNVFEKGEKCNVLLCL